MRRSKWTGKVWHTTASSLLTVSVLVGLVTVQVVAAEVSASFYLDEVLGFLIVGVLSQSLGILGHETYHRSFFRSERANDVAGAWLFHYPLLGRFEQLKEEHLRHHRFFGTDRDPDRDHWAWDAGDRRHLKKILGIVTGWSFLMNVLALVSGRSRTQTESDTTTSHSAMKDLLGILICQLAIFAGFSLFLGWYRYLLLWIFPIVTVGSLIEHLRVFCEHNEAKLRVFSDPSWLGLFVFGRANFRLHAIHHQAPAIPWFALGAKYSNVLARERSKVEESADYFTQLRKVLK